MPPSASQPGYERSCIASPHELHRRQSKPPGPTVLLSWQARRESCDASRIAARQLGYVPRNTRTARTRRWSSAAGARLSFAHTRDPQGVGHDPHRFGPLAIGGGFEYGTSVTSPMRPSGLEPPRAVKLTRPSTLHPGPDASAGVPIVRFVRVRGHIGHVGRNDLCQRCATPEMSQIFPTLCGVFQCHTRVRTEHSFVGVFARRSSLNDKTEHRRSSACHNDRSEAAAGRFTTAGPIQYSDGFAPLRHPP
jgi:hypothetical protein